MPMTRRRHARWLAGPLVVLVLLQTGCATTMLRDARVSPPPEARHCEGSELVITSYMATLQIPLVAFFLPRIRLNAPDSTEALRKCGGTQQVNRLVKANYAACAPTNFLMTMLTLGTVGACPTLVSYEADVVD